DSVAEKTFLIPYDKGALLSRLHDIGETLSVEYADEGTRVCIRADKAAFKRLGTAYAAYDEEKA
ncbi:MAG: hypothetical protein PHD32_08990, partial [Eubacteriales bacterium]|nr:hypothetical protein [Eubacteriales bacterium]